MNTFQKRVALGAAWLDRTDPTWVNEVDLDTLDLIDGCKCVLGQIVGRVDDNCDFYSAIEGYRSSSDDELLGEALPNFVLSMDEAREFGFHCYLNEGHDEWQELTDEWRTLIEKRREAAGV